MKKTAAILTMFLASAFFARVPVLAKTAGAGSSVETYTVRVKNSIPHDPRNFTQGLVYREGMLYESTGLDGHSTLQKTDARTGEVLKTAHVPNVFAEGLAVWENLLVQLTWRNRIAYIYRVSDFSPAGTFKYDTDGWGLTSDGKSLIMSDGSDVVYFRNPMSFSVERQIRVTLHGKPVRHINELEYVDGRIFANVWMESHIVRIDPDDGDVDGVIDAGALFEYLPPLGREAVLNGIAYNEESKTFFLTGKNWPLIFEVEFVFESGRVFP